MRMCFFRVLKSSLGEILFAIVQALFLSLIVLSAVFDVSCRVTTEGIQILSGDYESPKLLSVFSESDSVVSAVFSEEVSVVGMSMSEFTVTEGEDYDGLAASLYAASGFENSLPLSVEMRDDGKKIVCNLGEPTQIGKKYILYGEIEDKNGNTLTFTSPITGFNDDMATIVLSEIQDGQYASSKIKRYEFIELYVLEPGNLSGLVLSSAYDGQEYDYTLPAIEVSAKDIITVHLRNNGEDGCISEYDDDLTVSTADGSSDDARDLWADCIKARLGASQDVITIKNGNTGEVQDAFLYAKPEKTEWASSCQIAAKSAYESGIWSAGNAITDAFIFTGSSYIIATRTDLSELDLLAESGTLPEVIPASAESWLRITGSAATPGFIGFE